MDWDEWKARRQKAPAVARVPLCADGDALADLEEAQRSRDPAVRQRIGALAERVKDATITVVLQTLPADEYRDLRDQYRPDPEAVKAGERWTDDFRAALVASSIVEPVDADPAELWEMASEGERKLLFVEAFDLNDKVPDLDFTRPDIR